MGYGKKYFVGFFGKKSFSSRIVSFGWWEIREIMLLIRNPIESSIMISNATNPLK